MSWSTTGSRIRPSSVRMTWCSTSSRIARSWRRALAPGGLPAGWRLNGALLRSVTVDRSSDSSPSGASGARGAGRSDIGGWDTLRLRLEMKRRQLARLHAQVTRLPSTEPLAARTAEALDAVGEQLDLCPDAPDPVGRIGRSASVAQWKSSSVLRKGLGVRVPPGAHL